MEKGFHVDSLQIQNFMSVGNVLQTVNFENGNMRVVTGEDLGSTTLKRSGIGKAQPLYSKVKVKNGWKRIGDLGVGDSVVTPQGIDTIVTGTYPQGKKPVFTIMLEDGRKVEACKEHLWKVFIKGRGWNVISTEEVVTHMKKESVYIPLLEDDSDGDGKLPYHPYLIAQCLIGGEISDAGFITLNVFDDDVQRMVEESLYGNDTVTVLRNEKGLTLYDSTATIGREIESFLYGSDIVEFMVNGCSRNQRTEFLRAIFDLYGYENDEGQLTCQFSEAEKRLSELTQRLVWSLGGIDRVKKNVISDELFNMEEEYQHYIQLTQPNKFFNSLSKKTFSGDNDLLLRIKSINFKKETECVCISVLCDSSLYITDNYIVTHNTTIPNALAYAFYGKPVAKIKVSLLPNKTNQKNMFVRVNFRKDGKKYFIERGVKPDVFRFVELLDSGEKEFNGTQGTKADTQIEIERILGMSLELFTMIVTINTINDCFMKKPLSKQRDIIEEILNISELTRKAKILSDYRIKESKTEIDKEQVRIETQVSMKKRAGQQLQQSQRQFEQWVGNHQRKLVDMYQQLETYQNIDITEEISKHEQNDVVSENNRRRDEINNELRGTKQLLTQGTKRLTEINHMLDSFSKNTCPTCQQTVEDGDHKQQEDKLLGEAREYFTLLEEGEGKATQLESDMGELDEGTILPTSYRSINDAYNHQHGMNNLLNNIKSLEEETNPHGETVENSKSLLDDTEVSYETLEKLENQLKHQQFLLKMLTGRDSFIRKRIIDISLPVLNQNIERYLRRTNIRHEIKFMSDLTLEIHKAGNEFDFEQLSRGEQNWAIIALNLAMRDLYEDLSGTMNVVIVDELIDFGVDLGQSIDAFHILKEMTRDRNKSVSLITHREELFEKADDILYTLMDNEFTSYEVRTN